MMMYLYLYISNYYDNVLKNFNIEIIMNYYGKVKIYV